MIRSTARYRLLHWLLAFVALSSGVLTTRLNAAEDRPNVLLVHLDDPEFANFRRLIFEKRPAEELYDLKSDPHQIYNVAEQSVYAAKLSELRLRVDHWMQSTGDPRVDSESDVFDTYPYYGKAASRPAEK